MFRSLAGALLALLVSGVIPAPVAAQDSVAVPPPRVGTRVRVFAPDLRTDRYVGRIQELDNAVMVLDTGEVRTVLGVSSGPVLVDEFRRVTIRLTTIESMEVSGGRTSGGAMFRGALLGSLAGGVLIGLGNVPEVNPQTSDFVRAAPVGMALGAVVGAVIGFKMGRERWLPAHIPR